MGSLKPLLAPTATTPSLSGLLKHRCGATRVITAHSRLVVLEKLHQDMREQTWFNFWNCNVIAHMCTWGEAQSGNTVTVRLLFVFCEIPAKALSLSLYCRATCFCRLIWCILYVIKMQSKTKKTKIRLLRKSLSRQSSTERVPKWPIWPDTQMISKCCSAAAGRGFHPAALITGKLCSTSWTKKVHVRLCHSFIFLLSCCPAHLVYCRKFTN